jgi:hypothetical protein
LFLFFPPLSLCLLLLLILAFKWSTTSPALILPSSSFHNHTTIAHLTLHYLSSSYTRAYPKVSGLSHSEICTLIFGVARREATQRVTAAKLTRLTHKIAIQLRLEVESCSICCCRSR